MYGVCLSRTFEHMLQSAYSATIVNQIVEDRVASAIRARREPVRRRRIFGRRAAPLTTFVGRPRIAR
jgi:hypothetical protein